MASLSLSLSQRLALSPWYLEQLETAGGTKQHQLTHDNEEIQTITHRTHLVTHSHTSGSGGGEKHEASGYTSRSSGSFDTDARRSRSSAVHLPSPPLLPSSSSSSLECHVSWMMHFSPPAGRPAAGDRTFFFQVRSNFCCREVQVATPKVAKESIFFFLFSVNYK